MAASTGGDSMVELLQSVQQVGPAQTNTPTSTNSNSDEELERSIATRPRRWLTAEEKVQRRRLQYKLHQRRHRAKQKERTVELEGDVGELVEAINVLSHDRQTLLKSQHVFSSRSLTTGAPAKVAMEYVRKFEYGYAPRRSEVQEQFLRGTMLENVAGPDYEGIDEIMDQWRLYSSFFAKIRYIPSSVDVSTISEMTAVTVAVDLMIWPKREGLLCLYPAVRNDEVVIQEMITKPLTVPGKMRFVFQEQGPCSWFETDMDFVAGLQRALGSLTKVLQCMEGANISFSTGQILPAGELEYTRGRRPPDALARD